MWSTNIYWALSLEWASLVAQMVKRLPTMRDTRVRSLGQEDLWRRKWQPTPVLLPGKSHGCMEKRGRLQSMGSQRVGHYWETSLSLYSGIGTVLSTRCISENKTVLFSGLKGAHRLVEGLRQANKWSKFSVKLPLKQRKHKILEERMKGQQTQWLGVVQRASQFGTSRSKLLYIGWINNKVLLCSTGNYIQYRMINHHGKKHEKEYICITEPLFCTPGTNTILWVDYTSIKKRGLPEGMILQRGWYRRWGLKDK